MKSISVSRRVPVIATEALCWEVCLSVTLFLSLSFHRFCQLTHPFQESLVVSLTLIFSCKYLPSEWLKLGLSYCTLIQNIGDRPLWGWSAAWHFSDIAQWRSSCMSAFVVEKAVFVCVC